jgi:hypothetical protein
MNVVCTSRHLPAKPSTCRWQLASLKLWALDLRNLFKLKIDSHSISQQTYASDLVPVFRQLRAMDWKNKNFFKIDPHLISQQTNALDLVYVFRQHRAMD